MFIAGNYISEPFGMGLGAYKNEKGTGFNGFGGLRVSALDNQFLQPISPNCFLYFFFCPHLNISGSVNLINQVPGHAAGKRLSPDKYGNHFGKLG